MTNERSFVKFLTLALITLAFAGCGIPENPDRDKCFGSGGTHYVVDPATGQGQCVYDNPSNKGAL